MGVASFAAVFRLVLKTAAKKASMGEAKNDLIGGEATKLNNALRAIHVYKTSKKRMFATRNI